MVGGWGLWYEYSVRSGPDLLYLRLRLCWTRPGRHLELVWKWSGPEFDKKNKKTNKKTNMKTNMKINNDNTSTCHHIACIDICSCFLLLHTLIRLDKSCL